jgi:hypothetical protein
MPLERKRKGVPLHFKGGSDLNRCVLGIVFMAALSTGCKGFQPNLAAHTDSIGARLLPSSSTSRDILYASASTGNAVYAFSFPLGGPIGKITPPKGTISLQGLCSDLHGRIYVTALSGAPPGHAQYGHVYRYSHAGTRPTYHWDFVGVEPFGCSYDQSTGDLAVTTVSLGATAGALMVIGAGSQSGVYYDYNISNFYYCGYDGDGNLFVDGQGFGSQMRFAELRKGARTLTDIELQRSISLAGMGEVQWDGHYITIEDLTASSIYRLRVTGSKASVVGTTHLAGWNGPALSWIQGSSVAIPTGGSGAVLGSWKYPAGGAPSKTQKGPGSLFGVTVSIGDQR